MELLSSNDKGKDELLQQKEFIDSLFKEERVQSGGCVPSEDETTMPRVMEPVIGEIGRSWLS